MRWILALNEANANASDVATALALAPACYISMAAAAGDGPAFVPIAVSAAAAERPSSELNRRTMTIAFGANVRLTIEGAADEAMLSRVIDALAGA